MDLGAKLSVMNPKRWLLTLAGVFETEEPEEQVDSGLVEGSVAVLAPLHHRHRVHALFLLLEITLFPICFDEIIRRRFFRRLPFRGLRRLATGVSINTLGRC